MFWIKKLAGYPIFITHFISLFTNNLVRLMLFAILTRLVLLAIAWLTFMTFLNKNAESLALGTGQLDEILQPFGYADVSWYMDIAQNGYERRPFSDDQHANWAFYPLWPMVLRLDQALFGEMLVSGMVISTGFFVLAVGLLYGLLERGFGAQIAWRSVVMVILFPASYFFMRPGPEALFLFLSVLAFDFGQRGRWVFAGLTGALATLTRLQGGLLLLPLGYLYYRQWKRERRFDRAGTGLLLMPLAQVGFMYYMYKLTGNPLANLLMQRVWDNGLALPFTGVVKFLMQPQLLSYYGWDLTPVSFLFSLLAVILTLKMITDRDFPLEFTFYTLVSVFMVISRENLNASLRYTALIFPLFLGLARWTQGREAIANSFAYVFCALQIFFYVSFLQYFNWAAT